MPISAEDLKELRDALKRVDQIAAGLQAQAQDEEGRVTPTSEPPARTFRLR